jgi:site-specific DNA recombinase
VNTTMQAVIYSRVSTKEQTQNLSLPTQEARCIEYCRQQGWPIAMVFRDSGESARSQNRTGLQQLKAYCKLNKQTVGYVVVHDLSRFSRQMGDQLEVLAELETIGIRLRSVMENVDETAAGKLIRNIHGAFNQFDSDRKGERTKLGMQRAAAIGLFPFKAPVGYLNVSARSGPNLITDPDRGPLVTKAFDLYASGTKRRREVLRIVTALGLASRAGKPLTPQSFDNLLRNPIYSGWVCIPSWGVRAKGSFEPLVDDDTFARVQDLLVGKRTAITAHERNHPDFPLRVFVRCGECGQPLTAAWSTGRTRRYPYYRCRNADCKAVNVRKEVLEQQFVSLIDTMAPQQGVMRLFSEVVKHVWRQWQTDARTLLAKAKRQLQDLAERKNRLVDALLDGRIDQQTYDGRIECLRGEIQAAEDRLREADLENMDVEAVLDFAERLLRTPARLWSDAPLDQKQRLQNVFFPEGVTFSNGVFGTTPSSSFFSVIQPNLEGNANLASPTGFEPVLPP